MNKSTTTKAHTDAANSLSRVQDFDASSLVRKDELGAAFEFSKAVEPANRLIALFQKLPVDSLEFYPDNELAQIKAACDSVFSLFQQVLSFDPATPDAATTRDALIKNMLSQYQPSFSQISPFIAFSVARTANFNELASQGRSTVQAIRDEVGGLVRELESTKESSEKILDEVRRTAAERGVSQEAYHFSTEGERHRVEAQKWQSYTVWLAVALGLYAVATLFLHKIPFLAPDTTIQATQLIVSKFLVFAVLAFMLGLCAKNFLAHKHNQIVNQRRQNSLMTYKSLVDAGATPESRDIVLQHAAASIYRLHDTGYVRSSGDSTAPSFVEVMPRTTLPLSGSAAG